MGGEALKERSSTKDASKSIQLNYEPASENRPENTSFTSRLSQRLRRCTPAADPTPPPPPRRPPLISLFSSLARLREGTTPSRLHLSVKRHREGCSGSPPSQKRTAGGVRVNKSRGWIIGLVFWPGWSETALKGS